VLHRYHDVSDRSRPFGDSVFIRRQSNHHRQAHPRAPKGIRVSSVSGRSSTRSPIRTSECSGGMRAHPAAVHRAARWRDVRPPSVMFFHERLRRCDRPGRQTPVVLQCSIGASGDRTTDQIGHVQSPVRLGRLEVALSTSRDFSAWLLLTNRPILYGSYVSPWGFLRQQVARFVQRRFSSGSQTPHIIHGRTWNRLGLPFGKRPDVETLKTEPVRAKTCENRRSKSGDPQTNVGLARIGRRSETGRPIAFKLSGHRCLESTSYGESLSVIGRAVQKLLRSMHFWPVTRNRTKAVTRKRM
jgi:hypothetical protein